MKIYQVDAFTAVPFQGNPAGVCILPEFLSNHQMQQIALEMNLSETAFAVANDSQYALRWFTPMAEVDLCGHATLATAHILYSIGQVSTKQKIIFSTRSGQLEAGWSSQGIELDFPAQPPCECLAPQELLTGLNVEPVYAGYNGSDYFVEVESAQQVRQIKPQGEILKHLAARGIIVTARSDQPEYDFISRFFGYAVGVPEDPVTGSAHCALAPYWAQRLNKKVLQAYQASPRGGNLEVEWVENRVKLRGQAVTVLEGEIFSGSYI